MSNISAKSNRVQYGRVQCALKYAHDVARDPNFYFSSKRPPLQQNVLLQSCLVLAQCYASHLLCWSTALVGRPQCSPLENLLLVPLCLFDSLLQPKPPLTTAVSPSPHYSCLGGGWVANLPKNREMERFGMEGCLLRKVIILTEEFYCFVLHQQSLVKVKYSQK